MSSVELQTRPREVGASLRGSRRTSSSGAGPAIVEAFHLAGAYPFRIGCRFQGRDGFIVLEQLRTVDRARLIKRLGRISAQSLRNSLAVLREMFAD